MTLLQQIQTKLQDQDLSVFISALGYNSSKNRKVLQALTMLLNADELDTYLDTSNYDFRYNSRTLLKAICKQLKISKIDYVVAIDTYLDNNRRLEALINPYIFVDTNFKRLGEPIFALAMLESKRRIMFDKKSLYSKSKDEINFYVSNAVKLHYKWNNGQLPIWGKIRGYLFYDTEGKRTVYSVLGEVIEEDTVQESRARVQLNNKLLIGEEQ